MSGYNQDKALPPQPPQYGGAPSGSQPPQYGGAQSQSSYPPASSGSQPPQYGGAQSQPQSGYPVPGYNLQDKPPQYGGGAPSQSQSMYPGMPSAYTDEKAQQSQSAFPPQYGGSAYPGYAQDKPPQYGGGSAYNAMPGYGPEKSQAQYAPSYMPACPGMPTGDPGHTPAAGFPGPQGAGASTYPGIHPPGPGGFAMPAPGASTGGQHSYTPSYGHPPPAAHDPLFYLGTPIPDPNAPRAPPTALKVPGYDPIEDYQAIVSSSKDRSKRFCETLVKIFSNRNALQIDALADLFLAKSGGTLEAFVGGKTSGHFSSALKALCLGPLGYDAYLLRWAMEGAGTKEKTLIEVLLGRESSEIRWLVTAYRIRYSRDLVKDVESETSGDTRKLFKMALAAQRPPPTEPVNESLVKDDVGRLRVAARGLGTDSVTFFEILINRSTPHVSRVIGEYAVQFKSLSKLIKKEFSGTVRAGLLHIVHGAKPKRDGQGIHRDAKLMEAAMKGFGTDDDALVWRVVRAHWDPTRMARVREAYLRRYGKALEDRVRGETSGGYRDLMVALVRVGEGR